MATKPTRRGPLKGQLGGVLGAGAPPPAPAQDFGVPALRMNLPSHGAGRPSTVAPRHASRPSPTAQAAAGTWAVPEQAWLTCDDPLAMLDDVAGRASTRKLRLFVCAGLRRYMTSISPAHRDCLRL